MGEAKRRGTRDERIAAAIPKTKPEPRQYKPTIPYRNRALDFLFGNFKIDDAGQTINELREKIAEVIKKGRQHDADADRIAD